MTGAAPGVGWVIVLAAVPILVGAILAVGAKPVVDRLAPAAAAVLLTSVALTIALATGVLLCLAALVGLAELPAIALLSKWSPHALRDTIPMPAGVGVAGGLIAALLAWSAGVHLVRAVVCARRTSVTAAQLAAPASGLVLVEDSAAFAYAVPGRHRRIVASTGMLRRLSAPQRRALLAHEEAHLRHHHHLYVQLGRLAAAANPLMRPVSRAIDLAVERWADESAAREVGDAATVARALGAAALGHAAVPSAALAAAQGDVVHRVRALLRPPRRHPSVGVALTISVVACWIAAILVVARVHSLMELAETISAR